MPTYYFIYLSIILVAAVLLIRFFILRRTSLAARLFTKAVKAENSGYYEEATATYENALAEVKKMKFQQTLKAQILERLKVINTVVRYQTDQGFVRNQRPERHS